MNEDSEEIKYIEDGALLEDDDDTDDLDVDDQPIQDIALERLDARRKVERYQELKRLRELLEDPGLDSYLD
jgi:hypothetical protein